MFISEGKLKRVLRNVLNNEDDGHKTIEGLKIKIAELELKKRMEEEEIKHLVKMKEEKQFIEGQKKEIALQKEFQKKEMDLQSSYHKKVLETIEESRKESRELYTQIMNRLPNVNMEMKR